MKELELLKKDWKKQESLYPQLSKEDIYKMIHKKSSSIVKWILIICILEFIFWSALNFAIPNRVFEIYNKFNLTTFLHISYAIHYIIVLIFMYYFYKNYISISVIDTTHNLMQKILSTRRVVNYYIIYNIVLYVVLSIILNAVFFSDKALLLEVFKKNKTTINDAQFIDMMLISQILVIVIVTLLLWLYYKILYGILLKKLNKNYKELKTLE